MSNRRSIAAVLAVALGLGAAATVAGTAPRGPTDRSVKLDLIGKLKQAPAILILGDSRGRQAEPSLLQRLTGHTGFNAAVTGGSAPDAWVFTRDTADRFPGQKRRYIWFVSAGLTTNIPDPRMEADPRGRHYLQEVAPYLSTQIVNPPWATDTHYRPDGSLPDEQSPPSPAQVKRVRRGSPGGRSDPPTPARGAALRPGTRPAVRTPTRLPERAGRATGDRLQPRLSDGPGRARQVRLAALDQLARLPPQPPGPVRLRRRRLPGHPQMGRHRLRLDERDARRPRQHAPHAPIHRRPLGRRPEIARLPQCLPQRDGIAIRAITRGLPRRKPSGRAPGYHSPRPWSHHERSRVAGSRR